MNSLPIKIIGGLFLLFFTFFLNSPIFGETFHLKSGETINGRITEINDEFVIVESERGYGTLQIPRTDIKIVVFPETSLDFNQRDGVGYLQHKSTVNGTRKTYNYTSDQLSFKTFLDSDFFGQFLLAYGHTEKDGGSILEVFDVGMRLGIVFSKTENRMNYFGGSVDYIRIKDKEEGIDDDGIALRAFAGAEIFFPSLPNFGFSGELAIGVKLFNQVQTRDISSTTFPSFSMHYYF